MKTDEEYETRLFTSFAKVKQQRRQLKNLKLRRMDSFMDNLKQQVQCLLCNEMMVEPKTLQCFHTFCKSCLQRHVQLLDEKDNILECPRCNSKTPLRDPNGVEDLQNSAVHSKILKVIAFVENQKICSVSSSHAEALWRCLDCDRLICNECLKSHSEFTKNHRVISVSNLTKEDIKQMMFRESPCEIHVDEDVEFHCEDCNLLICAGVCLKDHRDHTIMPLQEFIALNKELMYASLARIQQMNKNTEEKKQQQELALMIERNGEKAKEAIKTTTKNIVQELMHNEQQLLNRVEASIAKAKWNLRIIHHTTEAHTFIRNLVTVATATDLAAHKAFVYDPYPQENTGFVFDQNEELCQQVENGLGRLRQFKKADPKMSTFKSDVFSKVVGNKARLTVELKTTDAEVTDETAENVAVKFTPKTNVHVGGIQMTDDGEIVVDFVPHCAGRLTVEVMLNSQHLSNSPQVMHVEPRVIYETTSNSKLKKALNTGSKNFTGVVVNKTNSRIAVADCGSKCVRVYNMEGDLLLRSLEGRLKNPDALAFLNETDLVISDNHNNNPKKDPGYNYHMHIVNTSTGKLVKSFDLHDVLAVNDEGLSYDNRLDVHIDDDDDARIIVSLVTKMYFKNNGLTVQVLTKDGDYLHDLNIDTREIDTVQQIVKHNSLFYISTWGSDATKVHVMQVNDNHSLTTLNTIDLKFNSADGKLTHPCGSLAIDNDNNLLICDDGSIHKFTLDGRYVARSSRLVTSLVGPNCIGHIAVLNNGLVICTSRGEGCFILNNDN